MKEGSLFESPTGGDEMLTTASETPKEKKKKKGTDWKYIVGGKKPRSPMQIELTLDDERSMRKGGDDEPLLGD